MATLTLPVPADFHLARDVCSYGYFLLAPNRWHVAEQMFSRVLSLACGPVHIAITQPGGPGSGLRVQTSRSLTGADRREAVAQMTRMLRLDEDDATIAEFHARDPRFAKSGRGRLLRSPTLFEDVIKTVTSCNVTWPSTVRMNLRLCGVLGKESLEPVRKGRRSATEAPPAPREFPTIGTVAGSRPQTLRARCRVGYRDQRIVELARLFRKPAHRGGINPVFLENPETPDDVVFDYLIELPGIGPYAAANIMQLLGRYARLPLDTESVRHGRTVLGFKGTPAGIMKRMKKHYAPFGPHAFRSYWFELWEFYERKHGPSWGWERDSTGKMFTAALLNREMQEPGRTSDILG